MQQSIQSMVERNAAIRLIKSYSEDGMKRWKRQTNYGKRSYVESFFSRLKQTFGFNFRNKSEINRGKELLLKCYLLINLLTLVWLNLKWLHEFIVNYHRIVVTLYHITMFVQLCARPGVLFYSRSNIRKRGDSNPRHIFICARFPSVCFRPLSHLSMLIHNIENCTAKQYKNLVYRVHHENSQYC